MRTEACLRGRREGDAASLARHVPALFELALRLSRSESDAWDLVQDTCERALRRPPASLSEEQTRAWLHVVMKNVHLDRTRRFERKNCVSSDPADLDALPALERPELPRWRTIEPERLEQGLSRLSPELREILRMQTHEHLSLREIGASLGLQPATVGTRAFRARSKLRAMLRLQDG